jgi:PDZ domain-containing secreted protein
VSRIQVESPKKSNKEMIYTMIWATFELILMFMGKLLFPDHIALITSLALMLTCPPLVILLKRHIREKSSILKWGKIIGWLVVLIVCILCSIGSFLDYLKVDEPYRYKRPGDLIEISTDRLNMSYTVNEHFQMVTVKTNKVTTRLDELVFYFRKLFVDGIEVVPALSEQQEKKENELEKVITQEGFTKPIIAALNQSGFGISFNEEVSVVSNNNNRLFNLRDNIISVNRHTDPGDIIYSIHDIILNHGRNIKTKDGTIQLEIRRGETPISLSYPVSEMSNVIKGVEIRSKISDLDLHGLTIGIRDTGLVGDSAGLSLALEIYQQYNRIDLVKGRKIAATGSIQTNGNVTGIGGIKFKYQAVSDGGCDLFIVPKLHKAEMEYYFEKGILKKSTPVIYVDTLKEAIEFLQK